MKKNLFWVLIALVLVVMPVYSGGAQDTSSEEVTAGGFAAPAESTTINYNGWRFPATEFYAGELEKLNSVDNLTMNVQLFDSGTAIEQQRLSLSAGGDCPFQILHTTDVLINEYASEGWLMPLDDLIAKYKDEYDLGDIQQGMFDLGSFEGKTYGIPILGNSEIIFYNMEVFEKHGLKPPVYVDDVVEIWETLKDEEGIDMPFAMNLSSGYAWQGEFGGLLSAAGGKWLNDDSTPAFNGPEGVAALEAMAKLAELLGDEGMSMSNDDVEIGLETGTIASAYLWASRGPNMDNPEKSMNVGNIGFAPALKMTPNGGYMGPVAVDLLSIPANPGVDADLIFRTIMEATDLESMIGAADYAMVTRSSVADQVNMRYLEATVETLSKGSTTGDNPAVKIALTAAVNIIPKVMEPGRTAQDVLDEVAELYMVEAKAQGYID